MCNPFSRCPHVCWCGPCGPCLMLWRSIVIVTFHQQMSLLQSIYGVFLSVLLPSSRPSPSLHCINLPTFKRLHWSIHPSCLSSQAFWQCNRCALSISGKCQRNMTMCMKSVCVHYQVWNDFPLSPLCFALLFSVCWCSAERQQRFHSCMLHLVDFSLIRRPNGYDELWH